MFIDKIGSVEKGTSQSVRFVQKLPHCGVYTMCVGELSYSVFVKIEKQFYSESRSSSNLFQFSTQPCFYSEVKFVL